MYSAVEPRDYALSPAVNTVPAIPASSVVVAVSWLEQLPISPAPTSTTLEPGGGAGVTVTAAVPFLPSLVAVIVAAPAATPVTSPLPFTVATAGLSLAHVTVRPASGVPFASSGVAVSWTVNPACTEGAGGLTITDATGTKITVTAAVPLWPSLVAVMVAAPAATPVTRPLPLTVATAGLPLAHVTTRPTSRLPLASFSVARSCTVPPTETDGLAGPTLTDATGAGGVLAVIAKLHTV